MTEAVKSKETQKDITKASEKEMRPRAMSALSPFDEMDRLFDSFFNRPLGRSWMHPLGLHWPTLPEFKQPFEGRTPKVDVIDRQNEIVVRAELPGVNKDNLDVSLSDNTVTIRASTRYESKEEKGDYYRCETSHGEFARTVSLPGDVDVNKATASFKDGLLELTLPKVESSKRRTIKIE
ncbi:MAG: Hsp20/alpha crystallin family protein [Gammaproteobacteria bacterium]|nr:Hsp20/alpha crystallin family protein [Gammaproteobacteria bacterium]